MKISSEKILQSLNSEEAVKHINEELLILLDNIPTQVWYLINSRTYGMINKAHADFIGKNKNEIEHKDLGNLFSKDIADIFIKNNKEAFNSKNKIVTEEWLPNNNGILSLLSITRTPKLKDNEEVEYVICSAEDITDKRLIEKVIRESEELFRMINISAQDAIIMVDSSGLITHWNPAAERILGYNEVEILGESLASTLVPSRYLEEYNSAFSLWKKTGTYKASERSYEFIVLRKDREEINVEVSLSSVKLQEQAYMIGIVRDITERKLMESLVKEQTEELIQTNNLLVQAKEEAEIANRAKSQFLANMSHEIRTPMNGVIGMTSLLANTELTPEQIEYVEIIQKSADALLMVINDILDFSKIEADKLTLEIMEFNIREVIEDTLDLLTPTSNKKQIELNYFIYTNIKSFLKGDPGRLRQILLNLCNNAIKFTEKGEVTLKVSLKEETSSHVKLHFSIKDTGIGISKKRKNLLFRPFSQVDSSTTRKYGGSGLGLVISKRLVEMMKGEIGFESEEGKGSTFWFTALFQKAPDRQEKGPILPEEIKSYRILIVDDNNTNRFILKEYLKKWGCPSEEAENGGQALLKFYKAHEQKNPFHIALLDMQMPEMDGITLAKQIKNSPYLKNTILFLLTSSDRIGEISDEEKEMIEILLKKPIKESSLRDSIIKIYQKSKTAEDKYSLKISNKDDILNLSAETKYHVLLAEDNQINKKVAMSILKKLGYSADGVGNGKEAVEALELIPYDIVLMDIQMPELDGIEATRIIRDPSSKVKNHNIPIIAMTAHSMKGDKERCIKSGMDDYISKPVDINQIGKMLKKHLSLKKSKEKSPGPVKKVAQTKIFNWNNMLFRFEGDEEFIKEVLLEAIEVTPQHIKKLRYLLKKGNIEALKFMAHSMKGGYINIDAAILKDIAIELEKAAKESALEKIPSLIDRMEEEFKHFKKVLYNIGITIDE